MKNIIKSILEKLGLLNKLRFFDVYRNFKNPGFKVHNDQLYKFYNNIFLDKKQKLIFDIGANIGDLTKIFSRLSSKVISVDPDPYNINILNSRFHNDKNIIVLENALASKEGVAIFHIQSHGHAFNTLSDKWVNILSNKEANRFQPNLDFKNTIEVKITTLDILINKYGIPDFIKIDVEGFEKDVIMGLNQEISLVSFENNLPEFLNEGIWVINHLLNINKSYKFNFVVDSGFYQPAFMEKEELFRIMHSGKFGYMEVFCKLMS